MTKTFRHNTPYLGGLWLFICLFGIFGNILTLIIISKRETFKKKNKLRIFLGNLAVADLISCVILVPTALGYIDNKSMRSTAICYFMAASRRPVFVSAYLSLTVLSLNRYYIIVNESKAITLFTNRKCWIYIAGIWIVSFLSALIPFLYGAQTSYEYVMASCVFDESVSLAVTLITVIVCIIIMTYCNVTMWFSIRNYNRSMVDRNMIDAAVSRARNAKIAKMVSMVTVMFMISYSLFLIVFLITKVFVQDQVVWIRIMFILSVANFANNVLIYGIFDKSYREEAGRILKCWHSARCFNGRHVSNITGPGRVLFENRYINARHGL